MQRRAAVQDGIMKCTECGGPMVLIGEDTRCMDKLEPEELVAVGFIPSKDSTGKIQYATTAVDQQRIQATQAYTSSVEIDNTSLQSLGLDLEKIKQFQLKHNLVP